MRHIVTATALAGLAATAAHGFSSTQTAIELGSILGVEAHCGLSYDQAAIERYIDDKVPASVMSFPSELRLMTQAAEYDFQELPESARTAYCRATARAARHHGFIE